MPEASNSASKKYGLACFQICCSLLAFTGLQGCGGVAGAVADAVAGRTVTIKMINDCKKEIKCQITSNVSQPESVREATLVKPGGELTYDVTGLDAENSTNWPDVHQLCYATEGELRSVYESVYGSDWSVVEGKVAKNKAFPCMEVASLKDNLKPNDNVGTLDVKVSSILSACSTLASNVGTQAYECPASTLAAQPVKMGSTTQTILFSAVPLCFMFVVMMKVYRRRDEGGYDRLLDAQATHASEA